MKIMYIFPHPDDESFGPAGAIDQQVKAGHVVGLLTLTQGGATKVRHELGLSITEMGQVRVREMERVQQTLSISQMKILDYPDGRLARINPVVLKEEIKKWMDHWMPDVVITYPVHGGSGHHDHITVHHVVKHLFYYERPISMAYWKRLAYFTVPDTDNPMFFEGGIPRVTWSKKEDIQVSMDLTAANIQKMKEALLCYETYQEMVKTTHVIERIGNKTYFELENENHPEMLRSVTENLELINYI